MLGKLFDYLEAAFRMPFRVEDMHAHQLKLEADTRDNRDRLIRIEQQHIDCQVCGANRRLFEVTI